MKKLAWKDPRRLELARRQSLSFPVRTWRSGRLYLLVGFVVFSIVLLSDMGIDFLKDRPIRAVVSVVVVSILYASFFAWLETRPSRVELWPKFVIRTQGARIQQFSFNSFSWYCLSTCDHDGQEVSVLTFGFPSGKRLEIEVPDTIGFETIRGHLEGKVVEQTVA
jgi:hypothetical protein